MDTVKIGIIGMGNMGYAHATCIVDGRVSGMELCAVCDIDHTRTDRFINEHTEIRAFEDYREMFASGLLNAVIVAVPHPLHAQIAEEAFQHGLHVLVEKPLDIAVSKAERLAVVAKQSGKRFAVMFNQRTNSLFRRARDIVQNGELGELKRTVWIITNWYRTQQYYNSGGWRATWAGEGGGVLINQAPHNLDLWQWICGMPQSVTAFCNVAHYHNIEVEDDATILTRYENGATGTFIVSTGEYPGTNRLEISGDRGKLVLENGVLKWWKLETSASEVSASSDQGFPSIPYTYEEILPTEPETAHTGILQNFTNAILFGEPLLSPGEDSIAELILSNAAYLSAWTGNRAVTLPLDTTAFDRLLAERVASSEYHQEERAFHPATSYKSRWQVNW